LAWRRIWVQTVFLIKVCILNLDQSISDPTAVCSSPLPPIRVRVTFVFHPLPAAQVPKPILSERRIDQMQWLCRRLPCPSTASASEAQSVASSHAGVASVSEAMTAASAFEASGSSSSSPCSPASTSASESHHAHPPLRWHLKVPEHVRPPTRWHVPAPS
jgi:hypothetical protein